VSHFHSDSGHVCSLTVHRAQYYTVLAGVPFLPVMLPQACPVIMPLCLFIC